MQRYFEKAGRTHFLYDPYKKLGSKGEVNKADVVFVSVPTPYKVKEGGFDLSYVKETCEFLDDGKVVVIKSTVVPGTTQKLQDEYPNLKFLFNPEFLTELTADQDMNYPDRQIIGHTKESYNVAGHVMRLLPLAPYERIMPATAAETVKYFGNTWFSTKVVFANQMYDLCEKLGIDYDIVKEAAAGDKRIGPSHLEIFHKDYRGYGGKCLPKDIRALIQLAESLGVELKLHKTVEEINNKMIADQGIDDHETFGTKRE